MKTYVIVLILLVLAIWTGCKHDTGVNTEIVSIPNPPLLLADTVIVEGRVGYFSVTISPGGLVGRPSGWTLGEVRWVLNPPTVRYLFLFVEGISIPSFKNHSVRVAGSLETYGSPADSSLIVRPFRIDPAE